MYDYLIEDIQVVQQRMMEKQVNKLPLLIQEDIYNLENYFTIVQPRPGWITSFPIYCPNRNFVRVISQHPRYRDLDRREFYIYNFQSQIIKTFNRFPELDLKVPVPTPSLQRLIEQKLIKPYYLTFVNDYGRKYIAFPCQDQDFKSLIQSLNLDYENIHSEIEIFNYENKYITSYRLPKL